LQPSPTDILWLVGYPALLAAIAMLATRPWRRGRDLAGWGAAVAVAGGFAIAFYHVFGGMPPFPPASAQQWLVFLGVPVILIAVAQPFVKSRAIAVAASVIVLSITPWLLLRKVTFLEPRILWTWIIVAALAMIAWWAAMESLARRGRGASLPMLLGMVVGVSGLAIINAHSATMGQAAGSVAIPLFVVSLAALSSRGASLARGGILAVTVLLLGLLLFASLFLDMPARDAALLALAPLAAWTGELPRLGKPDSWKRFALRTVAVLALLALPAFNAAEGLKATLDEQTESYSY
jgi:hypothetical protein